MSCSAQPVISDTLDIMGPSVWVPQMHKQQLSLMKQLMLESCSGLVQTFQQLQTVRRP